MKLTITLITLMVSTSFIQASNQLSPKDRGNHRRTLAVKNKTKDMPKKPGKIARIIAAHIAAGKAKDIDISRAKSRARRGKN